MSTRERWLFVFFLGLFLFNWPFLEIFSQSLPYYLFGIWGFYILVFNAVLIFMERRGE